jgi:hypothetical protein
METSRILAAPSLGSDHSTIARRGYLSFFFLLPLFPLLFLVFSFLAAMRIISSFDLTEEETFTFRWHRSDQHINKPLGKKQLQHKSLDLPPSSRPSTCHRLMVCMYALWCRTLTTATCTVQCILSSFPRLICKGLLHSSDFFPIPLLLPARAARTWHVPLPTILSNPMRNRS